MNTTIERYYQCRREFVSIGDAVRPGLAMVAAMAFSVHLVRHGEVDNPRHLVYGRLPGFGMTDRGRRQAEDAARYLGRRPVVAVWSSPLERALETAAIIAAKHSLAVNVADGLTEWMLADSWENLVWEDLPDAKPGQLEAYLEHPWDLPFSSETLEACADRMATAVHDLNDRYRDGDVVLVSHQDPVQAVRLLLTGRSLSDQHHEKPEHATVITLEPGTPWTELARYDPGEQEAFPPP